MNGDIRALGRALALGTLLVPWAPAVWCQTEIPRVTTEPGVLGAPFPYAVPEAVGLDGSVIADLADEVYGFVRDGKIVGGEIMIVKDRRIVLHEAIGWSDRERRLPMQRNSIYRIRSMTKPFIGTSILLLMEEDRLGLDDRVAQHLPSFDNERSGSITVRQLLTHTSGFEQDVYPPDYWASGSLQRAVDRAGRAGPPNPPGERYRYADLNSGTLGAIVARLSGELVEEFLRRRVLGPLDLEDTHALFTPEVPWADRMNSTYRQRGETWVKYWDNSMPQRAPFFRASGGLYTTVFDYARFLAMWMDRGRVGDDRLLSEATVLEALQRGSDADYGLHWQIMGDAEAPGALPLFGHGGSDGTLAVAIPERDVMVLYFTQSRGTTTRREIREPLVELFRP
jgi:CubicO group peptidase (beta-lactamase class C family)